MTDADTEPVAHRAGRTPGEWLIAALAAAPCFYLAWALLGVWAEPMARDGGSWVRFGVGLMILEFILLHSGAFMAAMFRPEVPAKKRRLGMVSLIGFYSLMAWAMSSATDSPAILWIFGGVILGRLISGFAVGKVDFKSQVSRSATGVVLYLLVVAGTVFLPIPEWGISAEVVSETYPGRGGGIWEQEPHRAVAGAALYFFAMGVAELFFIGKSRNAVGNVPRVVSG